MNKVVLGVLMMAAVSFGNVVTTTTSQSFTPTPNDLYDLPHDSAVSWGINYTLAGNEKITAATLEIKNLWNDDNASNQWNALWVDLLDNCTVGTKGYPDKNMGSGGGSDQDYFNGQTKILLDRLNYNNDNDPRNGKDDGWYSARKGNDLNPYVSYSTNQKSWLLGRADGVYSSPWSSDNKYLTRTIIFTSDELATLDKYIRNNNNFGLTLDGDCHFRNDGVKFTITKTTTTNVPEPTLLSLLGFGFLGIFAARRKIGFNK